MNPRLSSDSLGLGFMIYFCDLVFKIYERVEEKNINYFCLFVLINKVLLSYIFHLGAVLANFAQRSPQSNLWIHSHI